MNKYQYFVWRKGAKDDFVPELWGSDFTTGTGKYKHGEVKKVEDASPGDLVFFHKIEEKEYKLWEEMHMPGNTMSFFEWCILRHPAPNIREQEKFPEGEG